MGNVSGSKLILRILNRLGHSISYDEVKSLETEIAYSSEANERDAPDGVELNPNQGTGLAWDHYDVNTDAIDGKNTLHATVGICYQNIVEDTDAPRCCDVTGMRRGKKDGILMERNGKLKHIHTINN